MTHDKIVQAEKSVKKILFIRHHRVAFWVLVGIIVCANILISATVIPFLLVFHSLFFVAVALLVAGMFGVLYADIIKNILHLERTHHVIAALVVPAIAVINVFILGNSLDKGVNTMVIAPLYGIVFIVPYVALHVKKRCG